MTLIENRRRSNVAGGISVFAPISLLAHLGQPVAGEISPTRDVPNPLAQVPIVNPEPISDPPDVEPRPEPIPNPPQPPPVQAAPDAAALDSLIGQLKNTRTARRASMILAKMAPEPDRQKEIAGLLQNVVLTGGHFDKQSAADALGVWGSAENVPFLMQQLDGDDVFLKHHVLVALGRLGDPRAIPKLIDATVSIHTRRQAVEGLKYFGEKAEAELLKRLPAADDWQAQRAICDVLKEVGTAKSLSLLDALGRDGHFFVKSHAQNAARAIRNRNP